MSCGAKNKDEGWFERLASFNININFVGVLEMDQELPVIFQ